MNRSNTYGGRSMDRFEKQSKVIITEHKAKAKEKAYRKDLIQRTETSAVILAPIKTDHMARGEKRVCTRDLIGKLQIIVGAIMANNREIVMITIVNRSTEALTIENLEDKIVVLNIRITKHATNHNMNQGTDLIVNNANYNSSRGMMM